MTLPDTPSEDSVTQDVVEAAEEPTEGAEGHSTEEASTDLEGSPSTEPPVDVEAVTPEEGEPASPEPIAEPEQKSGSSFVPLLLGGAVAAAIGYAVPTYLLPQGDEQVAALQAQVEALSTDVSANTASNAARADEIAAIAVPDIAPLTANLDALTAQVAELETRLAALEARPVGESGVSAGEIAALRNALSEQQAASAQLTADIEAMAAQQAAGLANAETEALEAARAAKAQAARQTLSVARDTGVGFAEVLADLEDVPQVVVDASDGIPTAESLQEPFADLARDALAKARSETAADGSAGGRLAAFLQAQVGARSVEPQEGDSPDAVLSRAEAAVRSGDFGAAVAEISALPEGAQAVLADWSARAQTRADVTAALDDYFAAN